MVPDWFVLIVLVGLVALLRCRPRFSLRGLLSAITLAAVLLGIFTMASHTSEVEWENGTLVTE